MSTYLLHTMLRRFRARFLTSFAALTENDFCIILAGQSETLLVVLQARHGYTREQAKAAWNDFVLRSIDGCALDGSGTGLSTLADFDVPCASAGARQQAVGIWKFCPAREHEVGVRFLEWTIDVKRGATH